MIKDVFKLKKNSWHMSLMTWIWGYTYRDFSNMCPYFWLSVLNVIILPLFLFSKLLGLVFAIIRKEMKKYEENCEKREQEYWNKLSEEIRNNPNGEIATKIINSKLDWDFSKKPNKRWFNAWYRLSERTDLFEYGSKLWEIYDKRHEEIRKINKQKPEKTTRQVIGEDTVLIKKIAKYIGIVALGGITYVLYILALIIPWMKVVVFAGKFILCCLITALMMGLGFLIIKSIVFLWCRYGCYCIPCDERRENIGNFFLTILKGIIWPFVWIGRGIGTLWAIGMALKADNCPAIDLED